MPLTELEYQGKLLIESVKVEFKIHNLQIEGFSMKYINKIKKSILSKMALILLATATVNSYASHHEEKIESLSITFTSMENGLSLYVDTGNNTSSNTYLINFNTILHTFEKAVETISRGHDDELSKEINELLEYALQKFNILLDVFKRYNGKPDIQAVNFATEIKREFDVEKIFAEIICKLKNIRSKAQQTGNKHLVKQVEELANKIQQKKKVWSAKSNLTLITGLVHRMKCQ